MDTVAMMRALTFVCGAFLLLDAAARSYGSSPFPFDSLHGPALWALVGFGITWLAVREREQPVEARSGGAVRRAQRWAVGAALCFAGIGWSWTGGAPQPLSPTLCFFGALVCAVGALVSARDARGATPEARSSARAAAALAVGLAIVPVLLFLGLILLFVTGSDRLF